MRKLNYLFAIALAVVATPALADADYAVTPSGQPVAIFADKPEAVIGELSSKCIDAHWTVVSSTSTMLTCQIPMNMGQSVLGQMLLGNSYSTPPSRYIRFNVAEVQGVSRVQAAGWMELQMAFGQTKRSDFSGPSFDNSAMTFMMAAGGHYPVGTTFPNHVYLGMQMESQPVGKEVGLRVTSFEADSPLQAAGAQIGDVIVKVAGKRFDNVDHFLDACHKAIEGATYKVDILRDGKPQTLTVARAFRSPITEAVVVKAEQSAGSEAATLPSAPVSVADELSKLVKLRDDGVLTDAEFEAQKKKLLGE